MKHLSAFFLLCAVGTTFAAETSNVDYSHTSVTPSLTLCWSYELETAGSVTYAVITGVRGEVLAYPSGAISIPTTVYDGTNGYIVKAIADDALKDQIGVTAVSIPLTVERIGTGVFTGCTILGSISVDSDNPWFSSTCGLLCDKSLKRLIACPATTEALTIPSSITVIGVEAFANCHRLTTITIPSSVTNLEQRCFVGCSLLESLYFDGNAPEADATICSNPEDITIFKGSSSTGWDTEPWVSFKAVNNRTSGAASVIMLGESGNVQWSYRVIDGEAEIYANGDSAISTDTTQTYTYDSDSGQLIGDGQLNIPAALGGYTVTRIGARAFRNCKALTTVCIPSTISLIDDYAFENCEGIEELTLPSSLKELGIAPFYGTWIATLSLPTKLDTIDGNPVAGCYNLDSITVSSKNRYFTVVDNALFNRKQTRFYGVQTYAERLTIPSSVLWIATNAFSSCTLLESVTYECDAPALDDDGLSLYADVDDGLVSYTAAGTTGWNGDSSSTNMPADAKWPLVGKNRRAIVSLYNPTGGGGNDPSTSDLSETDQSGITWYYRIVDGVAEIYRDGNCAVASTSAITTVSLPTSLGKYVVKGIGEGALANLRGITSITIPSTYESIGDSAFSNCTSLASVTIGSGVRTIGHWPFYGTAITTLAIPDSVTSIDGNPGAGASMLTAITADESQPYFSTVDGLLYNKNATTLLACPATKTEISIPETVTSIAEDAFYGCNLIAGGSGVIGDVTWKYTTDGTKATISEVSGASGVVTIPATLGGLPVGAIESDALNGCTNITEFVSLSSAFSVKYGCLYSADGTILIRVPDTKVFPYDTKSSVETFDITRTQVTDIDTEPEIPVTTVSITMTTNSLSISSSTEHTAGNATFETILSDVAIIRDYAFNGCNLYAATTNSPEQVGQPLVYIDGPNDITAKLSRTTTITKTSYSSTTTEYTTKLVLSDSVRKMEPNALSGSGITYDGELPCITVDDYPYEIELAALNAASAISLAEAEYFPLASPYPTIVSDAQYRSYFALSSTPVSGKPGYFTVNAELDQSAIEFDKSNNEMTAKIAEIAAGTADRVTLSTKPGLYYAIHASSSASGDYTIIDSRLASGANTELLMTRPSTKSGFYKLEVSISNPK